MSNDVFEIVKAMDRRNIQLQLILQCAPTIAGLKTSNLFIIPRVDEEQALEVLETTGLLYSRLVYDRNRVVYLIFDRNRLYDYLSESRIADYLTDSGYRSLEFEYILSTFQKRYSRFIAERACFPHEMGLLLGYPLEDVEGFIKNNGADYLASGYWKVYDREKEKIKLFEEYDRVKDNMIRRLSSGSTFKEILMDYQGSSKLNVKNVC